MTETQTQIHNRLSKEVIGEIYRQVVEGGAGNGSDVLIVAESVLLGVFLMNERMFGVPRRASAEQAELLIERMLTRLAAL